MELVRVKSRFQITIPASLRKIAGIKIGDRLDVSVQKGNIVLTLVILKKKVS